MKGAENALFPKRPLSMSHFTDVGAAYWLFIDDRVDPDCPQSVFLPLLLGALHDVPMLWIGYYNMVMSVGWSVGSFSGRPPDQPLRDAKPGDR